MFDIFMECYIGTYFYHEGWHKTYSTIVWCREYSFVDAMNTCQNLRDGKSKEVRRIWFNEVK